VGVTHQHNTVLRAVAVFAAGIVISRNFGEALFVS
jgi:hypothetical protein